MNEQDMASKVQGLLQSADDPMSAARRMAWDDLSIEQKIERLRDVVKELQRDVGFMMRYDLDRLKEHSHGVTGEILVPLNSRRGYGGASTGERLTTSGKPWF